MRAASQPWKPIAMHRIKSPAAVISAVFTKTLRPMPHPPLAREYVPLPDEYSAAGGLCPLTMRDFALAIR